MSESNTEETLLAVFWDIENCTVPKGKSVLSVVQCIRGRFLLPGLREAEFLCVCDVWKEPAAMLTQLNDAQVDIHAVIVAADM